MVIHDRKPIDEVRLMTNKDYEVYGCTALLDALGSSIRHIGNIHKYAQVEDVPEHTMFVIITDGMENASRYYSKERVKSMIEYEKENMAGNSYFLQPIWMRLIRQVNMESIRIMR